LLLHEQIANSLSRLAQVVMHQEFALGWLSVLSLLLLIPSESSQQEAPKLESY